MDKTKDYKHDTLYTGRWDGKCPCCESSRGIVEDGEAERHEGYQALYPMKCLDCGTTWSDEYSYSGFTHYEEH